MSIAPFSPSSMPVSTGTESRALLILLILPALLARPIPAGAAIIEEIAAKVNNRIVTKSEFEERGSFVLKQIYQQYSGEELDRELVDAQESMLANMITELLLIDRAESLLDLSKVRKNLVDDFRKQQNIGNEEDLDKLLKEQGMNRHDLEEQLVRLAVPQEIINYEVRRKISVSEAEIKKHYEDHQKDWETPPTVTFNEIVLFYEEATKPEVLALAFSEDGLESVRRSQAVEFPGMGGPMGMTMHERIVAYLETTEEATATELARELGYQRQNVSSWLNGNLAFVRGTKAGKEQPWRLAPQVATRT